VSKRFVKRFVPPRNERAVRPAHHALRRGEGVDHVVDRLSASDVKIHHVDP
jgi:hypothetical protein